MVKEYKNNIFDVIKHIDNKEYGYYNSLDEESQKEIQPYTLTRWMSTIAGNEEKHNQYTLDINNFVNMHFWELSKYKDLQMLLLTSCGQKGWNKHQWIPLSKLPSDKKYNAIRKEFEYLSDEEFKYTYDSMTPNEIKDFMKIIDDK